MIRKEFSKSKNAMNFGAALGIVLSVLQLLAFFMGFSSEAWFSWALFFILAGAIHWSTNRFKALNDGYLSFTDGLTFGVMAGFGASLILGFTSYIHVKFIDPEYLKMALEQLELAMYEMGESDEDVEFTMELYRRGLKPFTYALGVVFSYSFLSLLISLVISLILKKPKPLFEE